MASFIRSYDDTMKTLLFAKFENLLDTNAAVTNIEKINNSVVQAPKDIALRTIAEKRGYDKLEFINFYRLDPKPSWERQRTPLARKGLVVPNADGKPRRVRAQPIDIFYEAWYWTKDLDKAYQLQEDYIFWQHETPYLDVIYDALYRLQPWFHFGTIVDESTVPEEYQKGRYFVFKMPIQLDGWVLKSVDNIGEIHKIQMTIYDKDYVIDYDSIVVENSNQDVEMEQVLRLERTLIFGILAIDLTNNTVMTPDDRVADFSPGKTIFIKDSTGNNGPYTVILAAINGDGNTVISLVEALVDDVADGNIEFVKK